jgi:hypothetical protein
MPSPDTPPAGQHPWRQLLLIAALAQVVVLFFALGLHRQLTLEGLQRAHGALLERRAQAPVLVAGAYMLLYVLVTAQSLPGAAVLTLAGGALFGVGLGTLLAFLVARTLLRDLAQAPAQLGLPITQIQRSQRLLSKEDADVAAEVQRALEADGVTLLMGTTVLGFEHQPGPQGVTTVRVRQGEEERAIGCDAVLCALGRRARLTGYGLEELGIPIGATVTTNAFLQTNYPNIYAAGDVAGPFQFTHTALFSNLRTFKADYRVNPRTTCTEPEVATVGLTEAEAAQEGIAVDVTRFPLHELDRAIVESAEQGFVKVLTQPGSDRILGATIVGEYAGELLAEFVLAMTWGLGLGRIFATIHAYPTMAEANKFAAASWKKQRVPQHLMPWLRRYHAWRRRG